DYIYEYAEGVYGRGAEIGRIPEPNREIVSLSDYRTRYAQYRRDPDLQEAHRQHPWIVVWDDHESTNDSWRNGAENHQPATEGGWDARRAVATQAWFEWMPVRENPSLGEGFEIYRRFRFGDLADVMMLDTRLTGRDEPAPTAAAVLANPNRSLLGEDQEAWLYRELLSSKARQAQWRFLGQQVMMGQLLGPDGIANPDQWDGYPAARGRLLSYLGANAINNVAVLTGDIHSSWGNEVSVNPFAPNFASQAVEFVTPAVSSPGIDDPAQAAGLAAQINATHPHVKFVELNRRGYLLVDVDRDRVQGEWYHVATIRERRAEEAYARGLAAASGQPRLIAASAASAPKANPPALAT
ncbi:MAG: alkaline phosphatase D family protein, partial [Bryobacteraceae bacterium]|nr:alkaline phosphatase D family protein [Bryobacteraceae bacterium]